MGTPTDHFTAWLKRAVRNVIVGLVAGAIAVAMQLVILAAAIAVVIQMTLIYALFVEMDAMITDRVGEQGESA